MYDRSDLLTRVALGAAGGFIGTLALQSVLTMTQKWLPSTLPPLHQDPGEFVVQKAKRLLPSQVRSSIPHAVETAAARSLAVGYGLTFGALYAALRPQASKPMLDGLVLGLATWAAGYLGWLPGLGLMPPVWRHKPRQAIIPAAEHMVYGLAAAATYDWLRRRT